MRYTEENSEVTSKRDRINKAIREASASQTKIADYCGVTVQSVGGWKRTGRVADTNLQRLATATGFRFLWLLNGTGEEKPTGDSEEQQDIICQTVLARFPALQKSKAAEQLLHSLEYAAANNRLSEQSLELIARLIKSLVDDKPAGTSNDNKQQ